MFLHFTIYFTEFLYLITLPITLVLLLSTLQRFLFKRVLIQKGSYSKRLISFISLKAMATPSIDRLWAGLPIASIVPTNSV